MTSLANATIELEAATSGAHAVTVQLLDSAGTALLQLAHEFVVFPTFSVRAMSQPLFVNTTGARVSLVFGSPVLLSMSMRTQVVCTGGGATASDTHVPFMASSSEISVPWRPFRGTNNSCSVRVRAISRQFSSSLVLTFAASMADALAAVQQPLQFTVGQPGSFPVYLPSSYSGADTALCTGDAAASVICSTRILDAAATAHFVNVTVTCNTVGPALVTVSLLQASVSFDLLCLIPLVIDRSVVHVRVGHFASLHAVLTLPCVLAVDCPIGWSCSVQDAGASIAPPNSAASITSLVFMSLGPSSCMNNATVTVHSHPLAVFAQPLLLLPPSPDDRGGLLATGHIFGPMSTDLNVPFLYSSAPRMITFCNLTIDPVRMAFTVTLLRSDVAQPALPCALPQVDTSLSTAGCPVSSSSCMSITVLFPCDECIFAPGPATPTPFAAALQLTQAVAVAAGGDLFVGFVWQLPRQSSVALMLALVLPTTDPVAVTFTSGPCASILPPAAVFSSVQAKAEMQVTWASSGVCYITATSSVFPPLNFTVINAIPPVIMSPPIVRANIWQRTVIITLNVPSNIMTGIARVQLIVSSQNETVGLLPSDSVAIDSSCNCARVPLTIKSTGITRIRSLFVEGPSDLMGLQQVTSVAAFHYFVELTFQVGRGRCFDFAPTASDAVQFGGSDPSATLVNVDFQCADTRNFC